MTEDIELAVRAADITEIDGTLPDPAATVYAWSQDPGPAHLTRRDFLRGRIMPVVIATALAIAVVAGIGVALGSPMAQHAAINPPPVYPLAAVKPASPGTLAGSGSGYQPGAGSVGVIDPPSCAR